MAAHWQKLDYMAHAPATTPSQVASITRPRVQVECYLIDVYATTSAITTSPLLLTMPPTISRRTSATLRMVIVVAHDGDCSGSSRSGSFVKTFQFNIEWQICQKEYNTRKIQQDLHGKRDSSVPRAVTLATGRTSLTVRFLRSAQRR